MVKRGGRVQGGRLSRLRRELRERGHQVVAGGARLVGGSTNLVASGAHRMSVSLAGRLVVIVERRVAERVLGAGELGGRLSCLLLLTICRAGLVRLDRIGPGELSALLGATRIEVALILRCVVCGHLAGLSDISRLASRMKPARFTFSLSLSSCSSSSSLLHLAVVSRLSRPSLSLS